VPYGYRLAPDGVHLVEHESEQLIIREIHELRAHGLTLRAIVTEMEKRGLMTRVGKPFGLTQIARIVAHGIVFALSCLLLSACVADPVTPSADAGAGEVSDPYGDGEVP